MKSLFTFLLPILALFLLQINHSHASDKNGQISAAKIIQQSGQNQWRSAITTPWAATNINQGFAEGSHVKTGQQSKIALLFRDDSQLRLNQNSLLIIKDVLDKQGKSTRFRLNQGRAWIKSKNIPDKLIMETPSAVAAIRGTDWDMEVAPDGTATLTVLHGSVHFSNTLGEVTVNANEQAIARMDKAPIKVIISNPKDRIQWVSEYKVNPSSYNKLTGAESTQATALLASFSHNDFSHYQQQITQLSPSAFKTALLADLHLYQGEMSKAIVQIEQFSNYQQSPQLLVLHGKAHLMQGQAKYIENSTQSAVITLFNGEIALFKGDGEKAIALFEQVLAQSPNNQQAWYQLGKIYTEKENISLALTALNKAISLEPTDAKAYSEKATLQTFINQFSDAKTAFNNADNNAANQALTLTGRGVLALKRGQTEQAKNYFLQAGTLAPQLARIQSYLAVSYYQLAQVDLAKKTLAYASELDANDPMPYFMLTTIEREHYRPQAALAASKKAIERLPYLKSLNQLANNLTGSTNLGSALAEFGLNDWATKYAVDSYNPFWAGSQLFLSNRNHHDRFVQQSELYKGLLNDPLVFGASKRYSEIIAKPGIHGSLRLQSLNTERNDGYKSDSLTPTLTLNGMHNDFIPLAFFIEHLDTELDFQYKNDNELTKGNVPVKYTRIGIGARLAPKLSAFYYKNSGKDSSIIQNNSKLLSKTNTEIDDSYYGVQYQLAPEHDFNLSYFSVNDDAHQESDTSYLYQGDSNGIKSHINSFSHSINNIFKSTRSGQINWRYSNQNKHFLNVGFSIDKNTFQNNNEISQSLKVTVYDQGEVISDINQTTQTSTNSHDKNTIKQGYFHWQSNISQPWHSDFLLNYHNISVNNQNVLQELTGSPSYFKDTGLSIGVGIKYKLNQQWLIRTSYQDWLNSGAVVTSGPSMLAGIPFSSEYSLMGSDIQRAVMQLEYENDYLFAQLFAEHQQIDNSQFPASFANSSTDLLSAELRQLSAINNDVSKIYQDDNQFVGQPKYTIVQAKVRNYHLLLNGFITERLSGNIGYRYTDAQQWDLSAENTNDTAKFDMLNQAQSRFRFGLNYSASFSATTFVQASYYDYPSNTVLLEDGWIWNIGWRQEFWQKRLLVTAQHVIRDIDNSKTWNIVGELRF